MNSRQPVLFLGHGDPMNALYDNAFTRALKTLGGSLPAKPSAVLLISAHWLTRGNFVSAAARPETIYDFGGFPDELYQVKYPAPGSPELAAKIADNIPSVSIDKTRGIDHGGWTVLKHLFPAADIPVVSMSIDFGKAPIHYVELGRQLRFLRDENVLVIGSGNIVHNIGMYFRKRDELPFDWAVEFDAYIASALKSGDMAALTDYERAGECASLSHPTNDHLLPLFYSAGARHENEDALFIHEEIIRSMSMRCVRFG